MVSQTSPDILEIPWPLGGGGRNDEIRISNDETNPKQDYELISERDVALARASSFQFILDPQTTSDALPRLPAFWPFVRVSP